jgi:hypothetical protein
LSDREYHELGGLANRIKTIREESGVLHLHSDKRDQLSRECLLLGQLTPPPQLADPASLGALLMILVAAGQDWDRERARSSALAGLELPPALEDAPSLTNILQPLIDAQRTVSELSWCSKALKDLLTPPELGDVDEKASLYGALFNEKENHEKLQAKFACLRGIKETPAIFDMGPLQSTVLALGAAQLANTGSRAEQRVLEKLKPAPELYDPKPLEDLIGSLQRTIGEIQGYEIGIDTAAAEMAVVESDLRAAEGANARFLLSSQANGARRMNPLLFAGALAVVLVLGLLFWYYGLYTMDSPDGRQQPVNPQATATVNGEGAAIKRTKSELGENATKEASELRENTKEAMNDVSSKKESGKTEMNELKSKKEEPKHQRNSLAKTCDASPKKPSSGPLKGAFKTERTLPSILSSNR